MLTALSLFPQSSPRVANRGNIPKLQNHNTACHMRSAMGTEILHGKILIGEQLYEVGDLPTSEAMMDRTYKSVKMLILKRSRIGACTRTEDKADLRGIFFFFF